MAKRFTDTEKWKKLWVQELPPEMKLLWIYLLDSCNHAGVWDKNLRLAEFQLGIKLDEDTILYQYFPNKIISLGNGNRWFIPKFIEFQYGSLNPNNKAHNSVIQILKSYDLYDGKGVVSPLQAPKDKDKVKVKDKVMDKDTRVQPKLEPKKKLVPPTQDQVIEYFLENGYSKEGAIQAFKYYSEAEPPWTDSRGKPVRAWKQKMRGNQFREEYKIRITDKPDKPVELTICCKEDTCQGREIPFVVFPEKQKPPWLCKVCNKEMERI